MDPAQQAALEFAAFAATYIRKGMPRYPQAERNLAIVGAPGSGKAYTLKQIIAMLQTRRCCYVISSDNAQDADNLGGKTIFSQFRIPKSTSPKWDDPRSIVKAQSNPRVPTFCHDLRSAKFWIFYGGFNEKMLQCMDQVAKHVRKNSQPFGGLFMIFAADFLTTFDFPPAFKSWPVLGVPPHRTILLAESHKHAHDQALSRLLARLRYNMPLLNCDRQVLLEMSSNIRQGLILRSTVDARNSLNQRRLEALPSALVEFVAQDTPSDASWIMDDVPSLLSLKVGALVMITVNTYAPAICSGMFGTITGFADSGKVEVCFQTKLGPVTNNVARNKFEELDVATNTTYSRSQIPLCLAWATSPSRASHAMNLDSQIITIDHCAGEHAYAWSYRCLCVATSTANVALSNHSAFDGGCIEPKRVHWEQSIETLVRPVLDRPVINTPKAKRQCLGPGQKTLLTFWNK